MSDIAEKGVTHTTAAVTLTTTTETVVVSSPVVRVPLATCMVVVKARAQLVTGASTTAVLPRIRKGTTTGGTQVGGANSEGIKAPTGAGEPFALTVAESVQDQESVQYSMTLQQVGALANGSCVQAAIEVEVLNG